MDLGISWWTPCLRLASMTRRFLWTVSPVRLSSPNHSVRSTSGQLGFRLVTSRNCIHKSLKIYLVGRDMSLSIELVRNTFADSVVCVDVISKHRAMNVITLIHLGCPCP